MKEYILYIFSTLYRYVLNNKCSTPLLSKEFFYFEKDNNIYSSMKKKIYIFTIHRSQLLLAHRLYSLLAKPLLSLNLKIKKKRNKRKNSNK